VRGPIERDVAQMLMSLDHAGRIIEHRRGNVPDAEVARWIHVARDAFLAAYGPVDPALLDAFEAEGELRELVYAARFLPRWRYAPLATLRARYGG
jgi:maltokinase